LLVLLPAALRAQLRGMVRDGSTSAPIGGAVVAVVDVSGGTTARTITNVDGRFSVARDPKAVRVRVIKIGYRPREAPLPAAGAVLELTMDRIPPMLATVRVTDRQLCPGSEDRGGAFQLWDQARAGLLATVVARELKPAMANGLGTLFPRFVSSRQPAADALVTPDAQEMVAPLEFTGRWLNM